jgi:hypothetical protein
MTEKPFNIADHIKPELLTPQGAVDHIAAQTLKPGEVLPFDLDNVTAVLTLAVIGLALRSAARQAMPDDD